MKETFDFNRIGKRMPYTVPEGALDDIEKNVWGAIKEEPIQSSPKRNYRLWYSISSGLVAASVCCLSLTLFHPIRKPMILQCWNRRFQN
jgi:hypothetical protein